MRFIYFAYPYYSFEALLKTLEELAGQLPSSIDEIKIAVPFGMAEEAVKLTDRLPFKIGTYLPPLDSNFFSEKAALPLAMRTPLNFLVIGHPLDRFSKLNVIKLRDQLKETLANGYSAIYCALNEEEFLGTVKALDENELALVTFAIFQSYETVSQIASSQKNMNLCFPLSSPYITLPEWDGSLSLAIPLTTLNVKELSRFTEKALKS